MAAKTASKPTTKEPEQGQFFEGKLKQARNKASHGLSSPCWNDLEGRLIRLVEGKLFASIDGPGVTISVTGMLFSAAATALQAGWWNELSSEGEWERYSHNYQFTHDEIEKAMTANLWTFRGHGESLTAIPPTKVP